jgi:hypothetical protein
MSFLTYRGQVLVSAGGRLSRHARLPPQAPVVTGKTSYSDPMYSGFG